MNREITPEEAREFAENVGWMITDDIKMPRFCNVLTLTNPQGEPVTTELWALPGKGRKKYEAYRDDAISKLVAKLPDFPSDLAACFEGLSHYSSDWDLRRRNGVVFECEVYRPSEEYSAVELTPQAAIIRAVNAAARARKR